MTSEVRQRRPVRREGVWLRATAEENAVFDPATGGLHLLNETARAIWELCDGATTTAEMVEAICSVTGLPRDVVTEDVERTLTEFERLGILRWEE
ncbi:MAG TPA: HPr-rel-A system PqqD family peptide chaperone [Actinomycetota bacterium]|jgi:PqqD family protein of HPr-rel-A system